MNKNDDNYDNYDKLQASLKIDCDRCSGLCCVALYCMKSDGFPKNKDVGVPCINLNFDFRCNIHSSLKSKKMRGCLAYDCFGAGQKVTQKYDVNVDWKSTSEQANEIFKVFLIVFQLHQMEGYLIEAISLTTDEQLKLHIKELIAKNEQMTAQTPHDILYVDVEKYRQNVNQILKQVSESIAIDFYDGDQNKEFFGKDFKGANLDGRDFSMSLMIAANFEGCKLHHTNFLGADIRDANIKNTDLSQCVFLTQMQINAAKGNMNTTLPKRLSRPSTW